MSISIIIDTRERDLINIFELNKNTQLAAISVVFSVQQITHGDITIACGDILVCAIERKTIADLAASIKDRRIQNMDKLYKLRQDYRCDVHMIIEGDWSNIEFNENAKSHGIHNKSMITTVYNLQTRDKCFVDFADNIAHTYKKIINIAIAYRRNYGSNVYIDHSKHFDTTILSEQVGKTDTVVLMNMLMTIPGIDSLTIKSYFGKSIKEWADIDLKVAMVKLNQPLFWNMLEKIPGLSKRIRDTLCQKYGYDHFMNITTYITAMCQDLGQEHCVVLWRAYALLANIQLVYES